MNIFETLIIGMSKIQTTIDNKINAAWDYTKEIGAIITEGLVLKNHIINDEDGDLYRVFTDDEIVPVRHPDLSTQPSILPFRFGTFPVKEVLSIVNKNNITHDKENGVINFKLPAGFNLNKIQPNTMSNVEIRDEYYTRNAFEMYYCVTMEKHSPDYLECCGFTYNSNLISSSTLIYPGDDDGPIFDPSKQNILIYKDAIIIAEDGGSYFNAIEYKKNSAPTHIILKIEDTGSADTYTCNPGRTSDFDVYLSDSNGTPIVQLAKRGIDFSYFFGFEICNQTYILPELPSKAKPILAEAFNDDNIAPATLTKVNNVWQIGELPFTPEWVRVQYYGGDDYYYYEEKDDEGGGEDGVRIVLTENGADVTSYFHGNPSFYDLKSYLVSDSSRRLEIIGVSSAQFASLANKLLMSYYNEVHMSYPTTNVSFSYHPSSGQGIDVILPDDTRFNNNSLRMYYSIDSVYIDINPQEYDYSTKILSLTYNSKEIWPWASSN